MKNIFNPIIKFFDSNKSPKEKDFFEKGYLTPQQFQQAGNQLTNCGWEWSAAAKQGKPDKNLPEKKQFLLSKAQSQKRIHTIMQMQIKQEIVNGFVTPIFPEVQYDHKVKQTNLQQMDLSQNTDFRSYQLSITYDQYYHCPRMWLSGNNFEGKPLSKKQIFQDIMSQYQNQTVTQENHPGFGTRQVTIHPCKHSDVFKQFIDKAKQNGKQIKSNQALFLFLKFMASIMPTVKYDFTVPLQI